MKYLENKCENIYYKEVEGSIYAEENNKNDIILVNLINAKETSF